MINKKENTNFEKSKIGRNNKILIAFVCIFLSVVLIFGGTLGIIMYINDANAVVKLGNVGMDEGVVRVFASHYKSVYLSTFGASDTEKFWSSIGADGKTHKENYLLGFENYLSGKMAGYNLVKSSGSVSEEDTNIIKDKTDAFLFVYGSKEEFNKKTEKYGFDYDDFVKAMEIDYASTLAFKIMYGSDGSNLKTSDASTLAECDKYLANYTRIRVIVFSSEKILAKNDEGKYVERDLTNAEKAEREQLAAELREAIRRREAGESGYIDVEMFNEYMKKSDTADGRDGVGYYLNKNSAETLAFAQGQPEIAEAAFKMEVGEFSEVKTADGVCFIYRCAPEARAYQNNDDPFFSDFYLNLATELYNESVELLSKEADFRESYYEIDLLSIPENKDVFVTWS